jgi:uncharacterized protein (TIGR03067 family)
MCWQLCLIPALLMAADDDSQKEAQKLQGTWAVVSADREGETPPKDALKRMKVVIKADTFAIISDGEEEKAVFKLDPAQMPKAIDLIPPGSRAKKSLGIYELDGDTLKLQWRKGGPRPTKFDSSTDTSDAMRMTLKREKKE